MSFYKNSIFGINRDPCLWVTPLNTCEAILYLTSGVNVPATTPPFWPRDPTLEKGTELLLFDTNQVILAVWFWGCRPWSASFQPHRQAEERGGKEQKILILENPPIPEWIFNRGHSATCAFIFSTSSVATSRAPKRVSTAVRGEVVEEVLCARLRKEQIRTKPSKS